MTFLPIARREMLVAARSPRTYRDRMLSAAAFCGVAGLFYAAANNQVTTILFNGWLFYLLAFVSFFSVVISGPAIAADALSSEKREGTLGLLFLTELRGHDIVIGKLIAHGLNFYFQLLGALPVLALPLILGGVTPGQYARVALVLLNTAFFSMSASLFISALSLSPRKATVAAFIFVGVFMAGIPVVMDHDWPVWAHTMAGNLSPTFTFCLALGKTFDNNLGNATYEVSLLLTHLLGWLWLLLASHFIYVGRRERPADAEAARQQQKLQVWTLGPAATQSAHRLRMLAVNPVAWLDDRQRLQKTAVWTSFLVICLLWSANVATDPSFWLSEDAVITTMLVVGWILKTWIASQAAHRLVMDRHSGALEVLLATPLSVESYVHGRKLALMRQFGWVLVLTTIGFGLMSWAALDLAEIDWNKWVSTNRMPLAWLKEQEALLLMKLGCLILFLWLDVWVIFWVGLKRGLLARHTVLATWQTCGQIILLPWIVFSVVVLATINTSFSNNEFFFGSISLIFCLLFNLTCGFLTRRKILTTFRRLASEPVEARPPFWLMFAKVRG